MDAVRHSIRIIDRDLTFSCRENETLLAALERNFGRDRMVGCRMGGCGICRIRIVSGRWESLPMSSDHVDESDKAEGFALACRIYPRSDIECRFVGLKP